MRLENWTFIGVISDQYDHNKKKGKLNELKKSPWVLALRSALEFEDI